MPTSAGLLTLLLALLGGAASLIWGLPAVFLASAVGAGLLLLSVLAVHLPLRVQMGRSMTPARASLGTRVLVTLEFWSLRNLLGRSVEVQDYSPSEENPIRRLGWLSSKPQSPITYYVETRQRGFLEVGPLCLITTDPFDLARRNQIAEGSAGGVSRILVWPHFVEVSLPSSITENAGSVHKQIVKHVPASDEEFVGLREYSVGDDPRRIHWPSSARHGELMVRQLEHDIQEEAVVYLDTDGEAATPERFEEMVSAAASLAAACCRHFHRTRLLTRAGSVSVIRGGLETASASPILDSLSLVAQHEVEAANRSWHPRSSEASLFAVLGRLTPQAHEVWDSTYREGQSRFVVQFADQSDFLTASDVLKMRPGERFADRWEAAVSDNAG